MSVTRKVVKSVLAGADLILPRPPGPKILIYHQVGTELGREMEVSVEVFTQQLDWLQSRFRVVTFDSAVDDWGADDAVDLVALTFDDGYRDLYEVAFPLLVDREIPFLVYLTTGPMTGAASMHPEAEPLSWEQVGEMTESGLVTVGAHTHSHPDLRNLTVSGIADELDRSDHLIATELGIHPEHFAYPFGFWSSRADPLVRERYRTATVGGFSRSRPDPDPYSLPRYPIQRSDGSFLFRARLRSGFRSEEVVRRRLKGYSGP